MSSYVEIPGGITAPQGFLAGSSYCGIKAANPDRPDMAPATYRATMRRTA